MRPALSAVSDADLRRRLSAAGKRRKKLAKQEEELAEDIRDLAAAVRVRKAIAMEEAAQRLGLNRTTIYQVYLDDEQPRPTARAA